MKLCKTCIYFLLSEGISNLELGHCGYQRPLSPVTGDPLPIPDLPYCTSMRRANGMCGVMGDNHREAQLHE